MGMGYITQLHRWVDSSLPMWPRADKSMIVKQHTHTHTPCSGLLVYPVPLRGASARRQVGRGSMAFRFLQKPKHNSVAGTVSVRG
jgi:hypothetical protein